jgi:Leucine-rich repeat (LRR) protein
MISKLFVLFALLLNAKIAINLEINQTLLIQEYKYTLNSISIDFSGKSINLIDINTFKGYRNLEVLNLEDNKINSLDKGLFEDLINLRELYLESNIIISIEKNIFIGLNKLEKVCIHDNPISNMFPNTVKSLCDLNPKCVIIMNDKCLRETTTAITSSIITISHIELILFYFNLFKATTTTVRKSKLYQYYI